MRKILALAIAIVAAQFALADTVVIDNIRWEYDVVLETATITSLEVLDDTIDTVQVPSELNGYPVTDIDAYAFSDVTGITEVIIQEGVETIGAGAFADCSELLSVTIPYSVVSIGKRAFEGCSSAEIKFKGQPPTCGTAAVSDAIKGIYTAFEDEWNAQIVEGNWNGLAMEYVPGVTWQYVIAGEEVTITGVLDAATQSKPTGDLVIPNRISGLPVTTIGDYAFKGCHDITSVVFPNTLYRIGHYAFMNCLSLKGVNFPDSVRSIGDWAFVGCNSLQDVYIPDGVTSIGAGAFNHCTALQNIEVNTGNSKYFSIDGVLCETRLTMQLCSPLVIYPVNSETTATVLLTYPGGRTYATIPAGITQIGSGGFYGCTHLTYIEISTNIINISNGAFGACTSLVDIFVDSGNPNYCAYQVSCKTKNGSTYSCLLMDKSQETLIACPGAILEVENLPSTLKRIETCAFANALITKISLPSSVTSVGYSAFQYCKDLQYVTFPENLTAIDEGAFRGCDKTILQFHGLPPTCVDNAVADCAHVVYTSVYADAWEDQIVDGKWHGVTATEVTVCDGERYLVEIDGFDYDFEIENEEVTFRYVYGLAGGKCPSQVTIPSTFLGYPVTAIGEHAFYGRSELTAVTLPLTLKTIGYCAFMNCTGLTSIEIPSGVTTIEGFAFCGCTGLISVSIPASVTTCSSAFYECASIRNVTMPSTFIAQYLFPASYANIRNIQVADGSKYVVANAFAGCTNLQQITLPTGVTYIGDNAFDGASKLTILTIPGGVMSIGDKACRNCQSLSNITFNGDAPDLGTEALHGTPRRMTITVQEGTIGWNGGVSTDLPKSWGDRAIAYSSGGSGTSQTDGGINASIVVTNVVIHYVLNSIQPEIAVPISDDTTFVTVITEVKGGNVAVPDSWTANYPSFEEKFGSNFAAALTKPTGKKDAAGNAMLVWQDYVAGTDPTDEDSKFTATVTMVDDKPVISYTPELSTEEKAKRTYKTFGKVQLQDKDWIEVPSGHESDYNFFKVAVEMK